jgi:hypothetical protein
VFGGKPVSDTLKSTVPPVTVPDESFVAFTVITAVPAAFDSSFVMGGVSFEALSATVNTVG